MKTRIAVLVSGGGTNLQALIDAQKSGIIKSGEIVLVASNKADAYALTRAENNGIKKAMIDRLLLTKERIEAMADGVREVIDLKDPIGEFTGAITRPNGLLISEKRVPLGVVGIIYEARPNVTVDAAALTLKTGNACILRGGKEAINSNIATVITSGKNPNDIYSIVEGKEIGTLIRNK